MLNVRKTAERLCVSEVTIYNFYRRGLLKRAADWLDRPLLFTEEEVDRLRRDYLDTPQWKPGGSHRRREGRAARGGG